jgi:hypothetical protein
MRDLADAGGCDPALLCAAVANGSTDGAWDMAFLFCQVPSSSLRAARRRAAGRGLSAVPVKWRRYGITAEQRAELDDPVGETALQDSNDQVTAMVAGHPELTCGELDTAAHIQGNIIGTKSSTASLGKEITQQGPATPDGGWATQTPLLDPDGVPYLKIHRPDPIRPGLVRHELMLALNTAARMGVLTTTIAKALVTIVPLAVNLFADLVTEMEYSDPAVFLALDVSWWPSYAACLVMWRLTPG